MFYTLFVPHSEISNRFYNSPFHFLFLALFLSSPLKAKLVLAFIQFPLDFRLPWRLGGVILLWLLCGLVRCSVGNKTHLNYSEY